MVLTMATTKGNANVINFVYNYYTYGTPVVDINSKTSGLKSQKIHFVD